MKKKLEKKINQLIIKIIDLLENDIAYMDIGDIKLKKDISAILSRLTNLIIQLNKKDKNLDDIPESLSKKDIEIIDNFIEKNRQNNI